MGTVHGIRIKRIEDPTQTKRFKELELIFDEQVKKRQWIAVCPVCGWMGLSVDSIEVVCSEAVRKIDNNLYCCTGTMRICPSCQVGGCISEIFDPKVV